MNAFLSKLRASAKRIWQAGLVVWRWLKGLPIVQPLYGMLYSRKGMIVGLVVTAILHEYPKLGVFQDELVLIVAELVSIGLVAVAYILGIAWEDAATKSAGHTPAPPSDSALMG